MLQLCFCNSATFLSSGQNQNLESCLNNFHMLCNEHVEVFLVPVSITFDCMELCTSTSMYPSLTPVWFYFPPAAAAYMYYQNLYLRSFSEQFPDNQNHDCELNQHVSAAEVQVSAGMSASWFVFV